MTSTRKWLTRFQRIRQIGPQQILLIGEALCWLIAARVALRVIPVSTILRWQQRPLKPRAQTSAAATQELARRVRHAVLVAVRYSPAEFVCFPQCLAASALLRRQGSGTSLHYGVTRQAGQLVTHTWLESTGAVVIGGEVAQEYSTLGVYKNG